MSDKNVLIQVTDLKKHYNKGEIKALDGVSLEIDQGEVVVIIGPSGSGKSTLLRSLNLLEEPTSGQILVDGVDITDPKVDINVHRQKMGMVFQHFNLFPNMTVLRNMTIAPMKLLHKSKGEIEAKAMELLRMVGLEDRADAYPSQLSGGQKQRAAVARALITNPRLILADEPTGALDSRSSDELLALFSAIHQSGQTIVMVTHSTKAAASAGRVMFIKDGEVFHQLYRGNDTNEQFYQRISDTLTLLTTGGEAR